MKKLIYLSVLALLSYTAFSQKYAPIPEGNPLVDAQKSLNGAIAMGITSFVTQGLGFIIIHPKFYDAGDGDFETAWAGILFTTGGIGLQTNTPILIGRAGKQIKRWDCPAENLVAKQNILKNIRAAQTVSILRTVLPVAGVMAGRLFIDSDHGGEQFQTIFFGCWAASLIMVIPEVMLIERARSRIEEFQNQLNIGITGNGLGLIFNF